MSRICATLTSSRSNDFSYAHMSRLWPTAAAACFTGRLLGYAFRPNFLMPETIAPEETIKISRPLARSAAISSASRSICSGRSPVSREATRLLPILMTMRVACLRSSSRMVWFEAASPGALHR